MTEYVEAVLKGINRGEKIAGGGIVTRLLLSVNRAMDL